MRDFRGIHNEENDGDNEVNHSHGRYDFGGGLGNGLEAAEGDDGYQDGDDGTGNVGGNAESRVHRGNDGVHLGGGAAAQHGGHNAEEGKCYGQRFPFLSQAHFNVVHRTAGNISLIIHLPEFHGQAAFGKFSGHAEEGGQPHPEEGAGAAQFDGGGHAYDVAGAYGGCQGGAEGFEGINVPVSLVPGEENELQRPGQFHDLQETQPAGQEYTGAYQKNEEPGPPYDTVDLVQYIYQHKTTSPNLSDSLPYERWMILPFYLSTIKPPAP